MATSEYAATKMENIKILCAKILSEILTHVEKPLVPKPFAWGHHSSSHYCCISEDPRTDSDEPRNGDQLETTRRYLEKVAPNATAAGHFIFLRFLWAQESQGCILICSLRQCAARQNARRWLLALLGQPMARHMQAVKEMHMCTGVQRKTPGQATCRNE